MKRAIAKNRAVYGARELSMKKVATELQRHCAVALKNHYAFAGITDVRRQRLSPYSAMGEDICYGFTIVAENKWGGRAQAHIAVQKDLKIDIDTQSFNEGAYEKFPQDMLDCLLSAGEKAFR